MRSGARPSSNMVDLRFCRGIPQHRIKGRGIPRAPRFSERFFTRSAACPDTGHCGVEEPGRTTAVEG